MCIQYKVLKLQYTVLEKSAPPDLGFVKASAAMSGNMDPTADPCQAFATYACGGWMKKHVIPDDM